MRAISFASIVSCGLALGLSLGVGACGSPVDTFTEEGPLPDAAADTSSSGGDSTGPGDDTATSSGDTNGVDTIPPPFDSSPPGDTGSNPSDTQTLCDPTQSVCDGLCVDTTNDPQNCGACGNACDLFGASSCCNGQCIDTDSDPANCGACGQSVCHGEICSGGQPTCSPGFDQCDGVPGCLGCKDTLSDLAQCGGCGNKCTGTGKVCNGGNCAFACSNGLAFCPSGAAGNAGSCVDTKNDIFNCGACGTTCKPTQVCVAGKCSAYQALGCDQCPCSSCGSDHPSCCEYPRDSGVFVCVAATACPTTVGN